MVQRKWAQEFRLSFVDRNVKCGQHSKANQISQPYYVRILNDDSTSNSQYKCKYAKAKEIHQFYLTLKFKTHFSILLPNYKAHSTLSPKVFGSLLCVCLLRFLLSRRLLSLVQCFFLAKFRHHSARLLVCSVSNLHRIKRKCNEVSALHFNTLEIIKFAGGPRAWFLGCFILVDSWMVRLHVPIIFRMLLLSWDLLLHSWSTRFYWVRCSCPFYSGIYCQMPRCKRVKTKRQSENTKRSRKETRKANGLSLFVGCS